MPDWTETNPLRVVTGYHNVARKFFTEKGFEHVVLLSADGALEAAPLMGTADIILDLVMLRLLKICHTSVFCSRSCDVTAWKGTVLTEGLAAGKHRRDAARKQPEGDRGRPHHEQ